MTFDKLVNQLLVIEAGDRYLGKSIEKLGPRGFAKQSSMPEYGIEPEEGQFQRGTYIKDDEATHAEMKALSAIEGLARDPEEVREMKDKIDDVVVKLSSVIKDASSTKESAGGKILEILADFQRDYHDWKSKDSLMKSKSSSNIKEADLQELADRAAAAKDKLYATASKGFAIIKASLTQHAEVRRALDVLANLKDFLADLVPGEGQDHTTFAKVATLHDLNARLKSSLIRKSEAPISVTGVKSQLKTQLAGDKQKLLKHIRKDRFLKDLGGALELASDENVGDVRDYYAGKLSERDLVTRLFL